MDTTIQLRYSKTHPLLMYVVPFAYGHKGTSYQDARTMVLESGNWKDASRADLVPSHEEDLYEHIYTSIIEDSTARNNIGCAFVPTESHSRNMIYRFGAADGAVRECRFRISDVDLYLFKTGIGFYTYRVDFPEDRYQTHKLSADELILFQNRIKELNIVRGFQSKGANYFCIYPEHVSETSEGRIPYYTLGQDIALLLNSLLKEVFYFPPRVNTLLIQDQKRKLSAAWEQKRLEFESRGVGSNQKKFKRAKEEIDTAKNDWDKYSIADIEELHPEAIDASTPVMVPDKALLYSYIVFNADHEPESEEEKKQCLNMLCRNAYYLTRGYKHSYKVAPDAEREKSQMFERHENDFWDAALEGAGDYVLLYDNLLNEAEDQRYSHFFDGIRYNEMQGDYFILYILLLYQHYSIVYYSKKISEIVPSQSDVLNTISSDDNTAYQALRTLKTDMDLFLANSLFEAVGQITDVCTLYSFIEEKLQIKKNLEIIRRGLNSINNLCEDLIKKKEKERDDKINTLVNTLGISVFLSIAMELINLITWLEDDWFRQVFEILHISLPQGFDVRILYCILTFAALAATSGLAIYTFRIFRKYKK